MSTEPALIPYPSTAGAEMPYPWYEYLRTQHPVYQIPDRPHLFVLSRYADVTAAAMDTQTFSSAGRGVGLDADGAEASKDFPNQPQAGPPAMILTDPPEHRVHRAYAREPFRLGRMTGYESMIHEVVDELIDGFIDNGRCEFVSEFAHLLPILVTCNIMGFPREQADWIANWGQLDASGVTWLSPERQAQQQQYVDGIGTYLAESIQDRYANPGDDVLSGLVHAQVERDGEFDLPYIASQSAVLVAGGVITTAHMVGSALHLLLQHPAQTERVTSGEVSVEQMLEEALRAESPVQWVPRRVAKDVVKHGVSIPEGSQTLLFWGSANRDPEQFPDPDVFDVGRENAVDHIAFGLGPHFCLGAPLARLEGKIAFERLFTRLKNIRLEPGYEVTHIDSPSFRGVRALPIEFDRA